MIFVQNFFCDIELRCACFQAEGAVGYAQWVCKTLRGESQATSELLQYAITQMAAVPAASDALERHRGQRSRQVTRGGTRHKPACPLGRYIGLITYRVC